jgi:hypothetical protein
MIWRSSRRQQAEFARITRDIDEQNSWFAIPALAPVGAVLGLEGAARYLRPGDRLEGRHRPSELSRS